MSLTVDMSCRRNSGMQQQQRMGERIILLKQKIRCFIRIKRTGLALKFLNCTLPLCWDNFVPSSDPLYHPYMPVLSNHPSPTFLVLFVAVDTDFLSSSSTFTTAFSFPPAFFHRLSRALCFEALVARECDKTANSSKTSSSTCS